MPGYVDGVYLVLKSRQQNPPQAEPLLVLKQTFNLDGTDQELHQCSFQNYSIHSRITFYLIWNKMEIQTYPFYLNFHGAYSSSLILGS